MGRMSQATQIECMLKNDLPEGSTGPGIEFDVYDCFVFEE